MQRCRGLRSVLVPAGELLVLHSVGVFVSAERNVQSYRYDCGDVCLRRSLVSVSVCTDVSPFFKQTRRTRGGCFPQDS